MGDFFLNIRADNKECYGESENALEAYKIQKEKLVVIIQSSFNSINPDSDKNILSMIAFLTSRRKAINNKNKTNNYGSEKHKSIWYGSC